MLKQIYFLYRTLGGTNRCISTTRLLRRIIFLTVSLLTFSNAIASDDTNRDQNNALPWRIVNRFRLFDPWFGIPANQRTLMNAGEITNEVIKPDAKKLLYKSNGVRECQLGSYGCFFETRLFQCLREVSQKTKCEGLPVDRYNYHDLFIWNPLENDYTLPGKVFPDYFSADISSGDWIVEIDATNLPAGSCNNGILSGNIGATYIRHSDREPVPTTIKYGECRQHGNITTIRFPLQVSGVVPCGDNDRDCRTIPGKAPNDKAELAIKISYNDTAIGEITPSDHLIVEIGDSFGSGEGNPDIAAVPIQEEWHPSRLPPVWMDQRCHRSMYANGARAALYLVQTWDPQHPAEHYSVTYINYACSGAEILNGLLYPYAGKEDPLKVASGLADPDVEDISNVVFSTDETNTRKQRFEKLLTHYRGSNQDPCRDGCLTDKFYALSPQIDKVDDIAKKRTDIELIISIGGNDIGFGDIVNRLLMDGFDPNGQGTDVHTTKEKIGAFFARGNEGLKYRVSNEISNSVKSKINGLDKLFEQLHDRLAIPQRGDDNRSSSRKINNIYLLSYPNPTKISSDKYCGGENFLGTLVVGNYLFRKSISEEANRFADEEVIKGLITAQDKQAKIYNFSYITYGSRDHFLNHGWCATDTLQNPHSATNSDQCQSTTLTSTLGFDPYCERPRWFRTIGDSIHTQSSRDIFLPLYNERDDGLAVSGSLHPTFEAHRYMGYFIASEVITSSPRVRPFQKTFSQADVLGKNCDPNFCTSQWLTGGSLEIVAEHDKSIDNVQVIEEQFTGNDIQKTYIISRENCKNDASRICKYVVKLDISKLSEGEHNLVFSATHNSGKTTTRNYTLKIDRTPPQMLPPSSSPCGGDIWCSERDDNKKQTLCATDENGKIKPSKVKELRLFALNGKGQQCDGSANGAIEAYPDDPENNPCIVVSTKNLYEKYKQAPTDIYGLCVKPIDNAGNGEYMPIDFKVDIKGPSIITHPLGENQNNSSANSYEICANDDASGVRELTLDDLTSLTNSQIKCADGISSSQCHGDSGKLCLEISKLPGQYRIGAVDRVGNQTVECSSKDCSSSTSGMQSPAPSTSMVNTSSATPHGPQ